MTSVKYSQPISELWPGPHLIYMKVQNNTTDSSSLLFFPHMDTSSPSLPPSWQPSCLSWAGAAESIILLQLCRCGCLINDTTNNNCHAVTSVSSSQLAQPGAALCRLPPQIRTPLEKLFTHLSSPQAPLHFVCPPKDPMEDIITFFKVRNNCFVYIAPETSDKSGLRSSVFEVPPQWESS